MVLWYSCVHVLACSLSMCLYWQAFVWCSNQQYLVTSYIHVIVLSSNDMYSSMYASKVQFSQDGHLSIGCRYQGVCSPRVDIASPIPCSLSYSVVTRDSTVRHATGRRSFWDGRSNCSWLPQFSRPTVIRWIIHAHCHAHTCIFTTFVHVSLFQVGDPAHLLLSFSCFSL